jgi:hypothetical protein
MGEVSWSPSRKVPMKKQNPDLQYALNTLLEEYPDLKNSEEFQRIPKSLGSLRRDLKAREDRVRDLEQENAKLRSLVAQKSLDLQDREVGLAAYEAKIKTANTTNDANITRVAVHGVEHFVQ